MSPPGAEPSRPSHCPDVFLAWFGRFGRLVAFWPELGVVPHFLNVHTAALRVLRVPNAFARFRRAAFGRLLLRGCRRCPRRRRRLIHRELS